MQFHDQPQHVTIGISSDDLPAAVRLQSARFRVLECMPQIGKRDAALLHRGPSMIVNEDSAPAEFESFILHREQMVMGKSEATVFLGPLKPGRYEFIDDFHNKTRGVMEAGTAAKP